MDDITISKQLLLLISDLVDDLIVSDNPGAYVKANMDSIQTLAFIIDCYVGVAKDVS